MRIPTIIAIGTSAGGLDALRVLVRGLPKDLPAAVFVVMHIGQHRSELPKLLNQEAALPAVHARDGEEISSGRIYVAPPDRHLVITDGFIRLTKGPRENWARPAIDPLFRSAAQVYGSEVIGVILTGNLSDGTAGLYEIKERGGITVVQDPDEAFAGGMPRSALANVTVDQCLPLAAISPFLLRAATERTAVSQGRSKREERAMAAEYTLDQPVAVTCPDCGGALRQDELGSITQFRCHIGHVYSADVMLAAQFVAMERFLEAALRSLSERAELCRVMAEKSKLGSRGSPSLWEAASQEALDQTAPLRSLLTRDWLRPIQEVTVAPQPK